MECEVPHAYSLAVRVWFVKPQNAVVTENKRDVALLKPSATTNSDPSERVKAVR